MAIGTEGVFSIEAYFLIFYFFVDHLPACLMVPIQATTGYNHRLGYQNSKNSKKLLSTYT